MQMSITLHSCERFLERVMGYDKKDITKELLRRASHMISQEIGSKVIMDGAYILPSFKEHQFVVSNGSVVTIRKRK